MGKIDAAQRKWLEDLGVIVGGGSGSGPAQTPAAVPTAGAAAAGAARPVLADAGAAWAGPEDADKFADAPLQPIEIRPTEVTLGAGETQQFNASGEFEDGNRDLTWEVTWTSSDPRVTIDEHGLATAKAVSSGATTPVTITASYPGSASSSARVTVKVPKVEPPVPPHVPQLQFITIDAEGGFGASLEGPIFPGDQLQLRATGVYDGLGGVDVTARVTWSALPKTVATVTPRGLVTAKGVGIVTVKASDATGTISNEIDLSVDEDRRPPPAGGANLLELKVTPHGAFEAYVDEVHPFKVTATYDNGKTTDWSKAVNWTGTGDAVEIDRNGVARMKAIGKGSVAVELKEPVNALHAGGGVYKGRLDRIDVTVLGAPSKAPVKLPTVGKLSKGAAAILVKHLAYLAEPRFMQSNPPEKPAKLASSGDAAVDRLLQLTAEVVTKWNDLKTLAEARKIWQQVQPKVSALLKQAEAPAVGVKRDTLGPALDAVVNITARVKSGPGSVAASQANTHPQTADIPTAVVYVKTPYGELFYMQDQAKDFKRLTDPLEASLSQAPKAYSSLEARLKEHKTELTAIAPFLKSPDAAKAEIARFASNPVITDAHIADLAKDLSGTIRDSLEDAQRHLGAAHRHWVEAENDLKTEKEVQELLEEAAKLRERADHAFEIVGGVIEAVIGAVEHAPSAVFKGAYDVITGLVKEFGDENLNSRAHALEDKAKQRKLQNLADHIGNAAQDVSDAMTTLGKVTARLATVEKSFERDRDFAEDGFDNSCKEEGLNCKFRFGLIRAGLVTARKTYDKAISSWSVWGGLFVLGGMLAEEYAKLKPLQVGAGYDEHMKPTRSYADIKARNLPVIDALIKDANKFRNASEQQMVAAEKVTQDLNNLRVTANSALANVPRRSGGG